MFDDEALEKISKKLLELDDEIEESKYRSDTASVDRLTGERERIKAILKKDLRFGGKKPRGTPSETDKLRGTIGGSLSEAYKKLRAGKPEPLNMLADHLYGAIRAQGSTYIYSPLPPMQWSFDRKPQDRILRRRIESCAEPPSPADWLMRCVAHPPVGRNAKNARRSDHAFFCTCRADRGRDCAASR